MNKVTNVQKIDSKVFGGDTREVSIKRVVVHSNTASALITFEGKKMTVVSILVLMKDKEGIWKLVSDNPSVKE